MLILLAEQRHKRELEVTDNLILPTISMKCQSDRY